LYRYVRHKEELRALLAPDLPEADLRSRDARAAILSAAMDLVGRQGLARTTLEEIAAAAGVSRGAIYWHFKSKDDLFAAIVADISPIPQVIALLHASAGRPLQDLARQVAEAYLGFLEGREDFLRAVLTEAPSNPDLQAIFQRHIAAPLLAALGAYVAQRATHEPLRPVHPALALQAFFGPLALHLLARNLLGQGFGVRLTRDEVVETFLSIFFDGIRAPNPSWAPPDGSEGGGNAHPRNIDDPQRVHPDRA
jgi:AcrR family transcriptional regulator